MSRKSTTRWSSEQVTGRSNMNRWSIAGIAAGAVALAAVIYNLPDFRRYQRIRRM